MRRLFPTPAANDADTVANHDATPVPRDWARVALIAVCVFHAVSPLVLRGFHAGLGADERVYVSQINPHVPAGVFTAPRARGLTLLTAPASLVSSSIVVLRIWLAVLAGIGLYLGMLPWLRLRKGAVVPLAAALWSGLWLGTYYAFEAMPNPYVAYGALATSGWVLLAVRAPDRRRYVWYAAAAVAFTALIRPSDCAFLLLAVGASIVVVRGLALRRRLAVLGWLAGGFMAGLAEWLVEAYVRFGGPVQRFHAASAENTGGLHWSLGAQLHTLAGPLNCRGDCHPAPPVTDQIWWFALVPLVIWGLVAARRRRDTTIFGVATVAGLSLAAEYILAIDYAAPRFLIPAYALLALPVAEGSDRGGASPLATVATPRDRCHRRGARCRADLANRHHREAEQPGECEHQPKFVHRLGAARRRSVWQLQRRRHPIVEVSCRVRRRLRRHARCVWPTDFLDNDNTGHDHRPAAAVRRAVVPVE